MSSRPTLLASAVQRIAAQTVGKNQPDLVGLIEVWGNVVGAQWSARTTPVGWMPARGGRAAVLKLGVSAGDALLVQHEIPTLLSRINGFLGSGAVGHIQMVTLDKTKNAAEPRRRRQKSPAPVPVDGIDDPELALMLGRLGAAIRAKSTE